MAGKFTVKYWFKKDKRNDLLKGEKIYVVADEIGIDRHYLTNIINTKLPVKHKVIAYAMTKCIGSGLNIEDVFEKENI